MTKLVKQFFKETGYTDMTVEYHGVHKKYLRSVDGAWTFKKPSKMIEDFVKWQRDKAKKEISNG